MKKNYKFFFNLVVGLIFTQLLLVYGGGVEIVGSSQYRKESVQPVAGLEQLRMVSKVVRLPDEGIGIILGGLVDEFKQTGSKLIDYVNEQRGENVALKKRFEEEVDSSYFSFVKSEFPEELDKRIDAIINQQYRYKISQNIYKNVESDLLIEIFPTPKSKIFVLQNIQDFFDFKRTNDFKFFNSKIYEICTQKINALERLLEVVKDTEGQIVPGVFKDKNTFYQSIDEARDDYMKQFGISALIIAKMSSVEIEKKINEVREEMTQVVTQVASNNSNLIQINDLSTNPKFRALISILAHLYYKFTYKAPMMPLSEQRRLKKIQQDEIKKDQDEIKKDQGAQKLKEINQITHESDTDAQLHREKLAKRYVGMKLLSQQEDIQKRQAEVEEYNQLKQKQPVQQSLWSRVKSWFGW